MTKKKAKTMQNLITYKQSEKWIFDEVEKHSAKGNWIKDILAAYLRGELVHISQVNTAAPRQPTQPQIDIEDELGSLMK